VFVCLLPQSQTVQLERTLPVIISVGFKVFVIGGSERRANFHGAGVDCPLEWRT
jgi:hypothetical protein